MTIPNPHQPNPSLIQQLCQASHTGDLPQVHILLASWRASPHNLKPFKDFRSDRLQPALEAAALSNQGAIASYLSNQGYYIDRGTVNAAVKAEAAEVLEVFWENGWNINQSDPPFFGPPLVDG